jgi:hypothetical protein
MANGNPGDHPLSDVLDWGSECPFHSEYPGYTGRIVALIREIAEVGGRAAFEPVSSLLWATKFEPRRQPELYEALVELRKTLAD